MKNSLGLGKSKNGSKTGKIVDYTTRIRALAGTGQWFPWGASQGHGNPFEGTLVPWKSHVVPFGGPPRPS